MEIIVHFAGPNTSGYDLGTLSFAEHAEVLWDTGLSMPWIDLSLLIWCLQQLAQGRSDVTFSASAASFDLKMSAVEDRLTINEKVVGFRSFSAAVVKCAGELLERSQEVLACDAGRMDLIQSLAEFENAVEQV